MGLQVAVLEMGGHSSYGDDAASELLCDLSLPLPKCSQLGARWDLQPVLLTCLGIGGHGASRSESAGRWAHGGGSGIAREGVIGG